MNLRETGDQGGLKKPLAIRSEALLDQRKVDAIFK